MENITITVTGPSTANVKTLKAATAVIKKSALPPLTQEVTDALRERLERLGPIEPLTVWAEKKTVIDGCGRLSIMKELGMKECPIVSISFKDEAEAVRYRLEANLQRRHLIKFVRAKCAYLAIVSPKLSKRPNGQGSAIQEAADMACVSKSYMDMMHRVMNNLQKTFPKTHEKEMRKAMTGEKKLKALNDDCKYKGRRNGAGRAKRPNTNGKPALTGKSQTPKRKKFNANNIIEADCRDFLKLIPNGAVQLFCTSIPYIGSNMNYDGHFNDGVDWADWLEDLDVIMAEMSRSLADGGIVAINVGQMSARASEKEANYRNPIIKELICLGERYGLGFFAELIWDKVSSGPMGGIGSTGSLRVAHIHENILLMSKGPHRNPIPEGEEADLELSDPEAKLYCRSIWNISARQAKGSGHPCPYPYEIPYRLIRLFTQRGQLVCDPFAGLGTTCRAAKDLDRNWLGLDIVPEYVKLAQDSMKSVVSKELQKMRDKEEAYRKRIEGEA